MSLACLILADIRADQNWTLRIACFRPAAAGRCLLENGRSEAKAVMGRPTIRSGFFTPIDLNEFNPLFFTWVIVGPFPACIAYIALIKWGCIMKRLLGILIVALFSTNGANATIIERTSELDLTTLTLPTSELVTNIAVDPFSVDVGDTLVFNLEFVGGRLSIKDSLTNSNDYIGLQFLSNPPGQTGFLFTGLWHFDDVIGELLANDIEYSYGGPIGGFTANTNLTDSNFSITGITFTVNVTAKEAGRPAFSSDEVQFVAYTGGTPEDAISLQTVPEPSTISLLSLALFSLALSRRMQL